MAPILFLIKTNIFAPSINQLVVFKFFLVTSSSSVLRFAHHNLGDCALYKTPSPTKPTKNIPLPISPFITQHTIQSQTEWVSLYSPTSDILIPGVILVLQTRLIARSLASNYETM